MSEALCTLPCSSDTPTRRRLGGAFVIAAGALLLPVSSEAAETVRYTYDALGRLVQVSHNGPVNQGATATYQYDKADNRSNVTVVTSWTSPARRTGDFNGDGRADILWRDDTGFGTSAAGSITDWLSNTSGGWTDNWMNAASGADMTWHIAGVADFTGNGRSDILWRNDNGWITEWLSNATGGFADNGSVAYSGAANNTWHIAGVGDFNGDGKSDILWRNDSGYITEWLASSNGNGAFIDNSSIAGTGAADNTWHVVGVGDFTGSGRSGILWRNDNGQLTEWQANPNGSFTIATGISYSVDPSWKVIGVGDFNCDGRADILWRNDNGDLTEWQATSTGNFITQSMPSYHVPTNVRVALIGDFNGDHCDDIFWRDTVGNISVWYGGPTGAFSGSSTANASVATNWNAEPR